MEYSISKINSNKNKNVKNGSPILLREFREPIKISNQYFHLKMRFLHEINLFKYILKNVQIKIFKTIYTDICTVFRRNQQLITIVFDIQKAYDMVCTK